MIRASVEIMLRYEAPAMMGFSWLTVGMVKRTIVDGGC